MIPIIDQLNAAAVIWWPWIAEISWQAAITCIALWTIAYLGKRVSSPLRFGLLLLALIKFAVPPLFALPSSIFGLTEFSFLRSEKTHFTPNSHLHSVPYSLAEDDYNGRAIEQAPTATTDSSRIFGDVKIAITPSTEFQPIVRLKTWLFLIHVSGMAAVLLWILQQHSALRRMRRSCNKQMDGEYYEMIAQLATQMKLRRLPQLLISPNVPMPMVSGILNPAVIVPRNTLRDLTAEQVRVIVGHELAHIKRGDLWINSLQLLLLAIWWFHPVFWLIHRGLRSVREECCDDLLLARGIASSRSYAHVMLHAARGLSHQWSLAATFGFNSLHPIEHRLDRILDCSIRHVPALSIRGALLLFIIGLIALPGATLNGRESASKPSVVSNQQSKITIPLDHTAGPPTDATSQRVQVLFEKLANISEHLWVADLHTLYQIVAIGEPAIPYLVWELIHPADTRPREIMRTRELAAWVLSEMGPSAAAAYPAVLKVLQEEGGNHHIDRALETLRPPQPQELAVLLHAFKEGSISPRTLPRIAPESSEVAQAMMSALKDPVFPRRTEIPVGLSFLQVEKPLIEKTLAEGLKDDDADMRREFSYALYLLGPSTEQLWLECIKAKPLWTAPAETLPDLSKLNELVQKLQDGTNLASLGYTLKQIGQLGQEAASAVPALVSLLNDPEQKRLQPGILAALRDIGLGASEAVPTLTKAISNGPSPYSYMAINALGQIGPSASAAIPLLITFLKDPNPRIRLQTAITLWRIDPSRSAEVLPIITALIQNPSPATEMICGALRSGLSELGKDAKPIVPLLIRATEERKLPYYWFAAEALCKIDPIAARSAAESLAANFHLLKTQERRALAQSFGRMGRHAIAAIPALKASLQEPDFHLREVCIDAISKIAPEQATRVEAM